MNQLRKNRFSVFILIEETSRRSVLYLKTLTVNPLKRSQNIFEISGNFQKIHFVMTYQMRNGEKFMTVLIQMKRMNYFILCF